jgi:hypothetical protein
MRVRQSESMLVCPGCGDLPRADDPEPDAEQRFCPRCRLPLVLGGDDPEPESRTASERRRRAWLIKPQLTEGPLVKVAWVRNQAEGEFIQSLLLAQGVPSLLRRSAGFDVPDMLFAGPRDVIVAASGVDTAREVLLGAGVIAGASDARVRPVVRPWPLLGGLVAALGAVVVVIWLLSLVVTG